MSDSVEMDAAGMHKAAARTGDVSVGLHEILSTLKARIGELDAAWGDDEAGADLRKRHGEQSEQASDALLAIAVTAGVVSHLTTAAAAVVVTTDVMSAEDMS